MFITFTDYIVCLFYLPIIYAFLAYNARKKYKSETIKKYFLWGFTVKVIGAIAVGLIYQYYYGFGDTFGYFRMGEFFSSIIHKEPGETFKVLFWGDIDYLQLKAYQYGFASWYAFNTPTVLTARLCSLFSFLSFGLYLPIAMFFALFSFSGLWKLYMVFLDQFIALKKELALFIFFLPSVFFWGSGILKDSITIGALGWITWAFYLFFIKRKKPVTTIIVAAISFYLIYQIKAYIAIAYIPAVVAWITFNYTKTINNKMVKRFVLFLFIILILSGSIIISSFLSTELQQISLENVIQQASLTQENISELGAGSSYSLGSFDPSFFGLLKVLFPALVVTLYRPFIWEVRNPFSLLSALESTFFIWFTLFVLRKAGLKKFFSTLLSQPVVLYCLTFALMFAVPVGVASGNFGTLVRYKIPCLPFYLIGLLLIYYKVTGKRLLKK